MAQSEQRQTPQTQAEVSQQLKQYFFDAARTGNLDMLKTLTQAKYPLNTQDDKGYTALILAAYHGQKQTVDYLLKSGADACVQDKKGNTALMGAIFKGEIKIARTLMKAGCSPDQQNNAGQTASMYATLFGQQELLDQLNKLGTNPDIQDKKGNTVSSLKDGKFH